MAQVLAEGQWVSHALFGVGVTARSTGERTTIKFDLHGLKTFVTQMLQVERIAAPDRPAAAPRRSRKAQPGA